MLVEPQQSELSRRWFIKKAQILSSSQSQKQSLLGWKKIKECLKFRGCFCVNAENKSGGLALYWVNGVSLEVIYDNKNIIAYLVYSNPPSDVWLLLLVYGPPKVAHREAF